MTRSEVDNIQFKKGTHVSYRNEYVSEYYAVGVPFELTKAIVTHRDSAGMATGRGRVHWILGDNEYTDKEDLYKAMEKL